MMAVETFWIHRTQSFSFLMLMVCLIRIPSMSIAILFNEVSLRKQASTNPLKETIVKWKKDYILLCDLVADINDFIAKPMLIYIIHVFVTSINVLFSVIINVLSVTSYDILLYDNISNTLQGVICIIMLALVSDQIPKQVSYKHICSCYTILNRTTLIITRYYNSF